MQHPSYTGATWCFPQVNEEVFNPEAAAAAARARSLGAGQTAARNRGVPGLLRQDTQ